ncbi:MAG TPA: S26 family signal peptidase [Micromonosporaceae bacterium]|nr:S26 family signal peptidase [Micromonosporaceae bacterium]
MTAVWAGAFVLPLVGAAWWLRLRYVIVTIDGASMMPAYRPGDRVLVRRTPVRAIRPGQVVVTGWPRIPGLDPAGVASLDGKWLIKRAVAVPGSPVPHRQVPALRGLPDPVVPEDRLVLLGDNAAMSHDSRQCGYFSAEDVLGVAVRRLRFAARG